jgi:glyoxylase-like metal-dependent hydrolase (beta-lactamase superfamily II)
VGSTNPQEAFLVVLVDTGFVHTFPAHLENFQHAGLDLTTIAAILTSHFHVDHTAALATARRRIGCPIVAHKNNVAVFETGDRFASAAHMPYLGWNLPFEACGVDHVVEDGDKITVGDTTFTAYLRPMPPGRPGAFNRRGRGL